MATSLASMARDREACDETLCALEETFGVQFALWSSEDGWRPAAGGADEPDFGGPGPEVPEVLTEAAGRVESVLIRPGPNGFYQVAIPLANRADAVAVAAIEARPDELLGRLAACFQRGIDRRRQLESNRVELDGYAEQISNDFEEIMYLLGLTKNLELCDLSRSMCDIAQAVLPVLRKLINAQVIALLPAMRGGDPGERPGVGPAAVWNGPPILGDAECCQLVRHYQRSAEGQTVIRNRLTSGRELPEFPGIQSLLLSAVGQPRECHGWLLALNRLPNVAFLEPPLPFGCIPRSGQEFGTIDVGMIEAAAAMLATHGRNLQFFENKQASFVGALRALVSSLDAKDSYTFGHSDRVAMLARRLAENLGLGPQECDHIYLAGLLHDVGKIGVPDAVLQKPGSLTPDEFALIKQHPERGYDILRHLDAMADLDRVLPGVLYHHERYDGKGYPHGLAGEAIPLAARIIAVADAFDAMSSSRPYRAMMPAEQVEAILHKGSGSQWDPQVVAALMNILPEARQVLVSGRPGPLPRLATSALPASSVAATR